MTARERLNYILKVLVSHSLYYSGLLQLWQSLVMRRKAVVLMYHRVLTAEERSRTASHPAIVVDRDTFAKQMALLKRRFAVLSVEQFAECLERKIPFPNSSCVITFDDGWRDNFTNALPVLNQHRLHALVFLPVNYVGRPRVFWQEALTHLLLSAVMTVRQHPDRRSRFHSLLTPTGLQDVLDLVEADPRPSLIAAIGTQKRLPRPVIERLLSELADELGVRMSDLAVTDGFIDWEQVETMSRQRIAFGGHGAEHLLLTQVSSEEAEAEIRVSKQVVDAKLEPAVPTFSYPNGYMTAEIAKQVKSAGYQLAFITRRGFVTCADDPFTIRRLNIHESGTGTMPMFLARLVGLW